jgi:hypothetical protein
MLIAGYVCCWRAGSQTGDSRSYCGDYDRDSTWLAILIDAGTMPAAGGGCDVTEVGERPGF